MDHTLTTPVRLPAPLTAHAISQLPPDAVFSALETSGSGLAADEANARLEQAGYNQLEFHHPLRSWLRPLAVAIRPLLLPLWIAALIAYAMGLAETAIVLALAALVNTVLGGLQERKVDRATAALRDALPTYAHVIREGRDYHMLATQVVPGDLLLLHSGEIIPADARVVEEHDLRTVNVALMGEAAAARKVASAVMGEELLATELPNIVYAGSRVVSGTARAVVYATGVRTAYGVIAALTERAHEEPSPLLWVFAKLGGVVMLLAGGVATLGTLSATNRGGLDRQDILLILVGLLAAAVPTGLMPGITVTLLEGARRLARAGALVRRLSSVETLGATTVICADKTGTLTQNEMTVREIWTADGPMAITGVGFNPSGSFTTDDKVLDPAVVKRRAGPLLQAAVLTSAARLLPPDTLRPHWHILGDPVEAAAIVAAAKAGLHATDIYEKLPELSVLPSTDALPIEGRVVEERGGPVAYLKGAASPILSRCTLIATHDGERPLNEQDRHTIRRVIRRLERGAMRTIVFARRHLPAGAAHGVHQTEQVAHDLVLLGLIGVLDPPRQEVEEAIRTCHRAGIRTMMLTGDYTLGAESIARRCALVETSRATTITGMELEQMDDATLRERLRVGDIVFARMTPEHKVRVVETLDSMGEVVLVTGGAANDVPAIKAADIGIAMGSAHGAAMETADVILQNDNFATLAVAVAEGRAVEQRARRLVAVNLAATVVKLAAYAAGLLLGWPLLLTVGQLLLIDILAGFLPAIAMGAGPPDPLLMRRRPRKSGRSLIDLRVYRLGYAWFGPIGVVAGMAGAVLMLLVTGTGLDGSVTQPLFADGRSGNASLQVTTAYIAAGVAALVGAGLRLRSSTRRYPLGRVLLALVVTAVAAILVALPRMARLQPFVELSAPPWWLWALALVLMGLAALLEWGRQQVDRLPQ